MSTLLADVQLQWTKKLGEPLQQNRYAFHAALSPEPNETWKKCFKQIVELFNKTSPFEASIHGSEAVVFGPLQAFENTLSVELEAAVSQTNDACKRQMEQDAFEKKQKTSTWEEEEKIREHLRKKFAGE